MSLAPSFGRRAPRPPYWLHRGLTEAAAVILGLVLIVWSILPIYNMVLIALEGHHFEVFSGSLWPPHPSLKSFRVVWTENYWYLDHFWRQFGNSLYIGLITMFLTLLIGSLVSFTVGRMRMRGGWLLTDTALLTYLIPASLLAIPFCRIMQRYGLANNPWSVIAAEVTFATPYAIFIFQQYGKSIPIELDESARLDGAAPPQVYLRIYLPLMAPALVAVGTYTLLLSWSDYLYQFLLLSSTQHMTVAVALPQLWAADDAPWNYMMAAAILYALPPIGAFYAFRRYTAAGFTLGDVEG